MTRVLDLGDLPTLLAGSRLPDHLRHATRADRSDETPDPQEPSDDDEGQP